MHHFIVGALPKKKLNITLLDMSVTDTLSITPYE